MTHDWTSIEVGLGRPAGGPRGAAGVVGVEGVNGKERRKHGREQLGRLWNDLQLETPFHGRYELPFGLPSFAPGRDISLLGLPGFYTPRRDIWNFPKWTSLYDTSPLRETLNRCIVFPEIDVSKTGFIVSAVDVERGTLKRFRNAAGRQQRVQRPEEDDVVVPFMADHIMASGSLAPQFPWTTIKGCNRNGEPEIRHYWDGGIVDNTPLGDAMEIFSEGDHVYRLLVVMNLYPLTGKKPENLLGVADRVHELSYGNRVRQDSAAAKRVNNLLKLIDELEKAATRGGVTLGPDLAQRVKEAREYKIANTVQIELQTPGRGQASAAQIGRA